MGWLQRIFGLERPKASQTPQPTAAAAQPAPAAAYQAPANTASTTQTVPPERVGLHGEYDQSGLAKRVALAFDEQADLTDIDTLWVAQTGSTVVLKGKVPNQTILNRMVTVARSVSGATGVDTTQVSIG